MLNGSPLDLAKTRRSFERKDNLFGSFLSWWRRSDLCTKRTANFFVFLFLFIKQHNRNIFVSFAQDLSLVDKNQQIFKRIKESLFKRVLVLITDWHSFSLKLTVMSEQKSKETCWLFYYFCCVQLRKLAAEPTSSSFSMPKNLPNSAYSKYPSLLSCLLSLWRRFTFIIDGNERACGPTTIEDHIFVIGFLSKDTFTRICSRMNNKVLKAFGHKIHP